MAGSYGLDAFTHFVFRMAGADVGDLVRVDRFPDGVGHDAGLPCLEAGKGQVENRLNEGFI